MPSSRILYLKSQKCKVELNADQCYKDLEEPCWELLQQHHHNPNIRQDMFRAVDGKIEVYDGGYDSSPSWSNQINLWGYGAEGILEGLAQNMTGDGELIFIETPEGNSPTVYKVTSKKVQIIA